MVKRLSLKVENKSAWIATGWCWQRREGRAGTKNRAAIAWARCLILSCLAVGLGFIFFGAHRPGHRQHPAMGVLDPAQLLQACWLGVFWQAHGADILQADVFLI